ncbi:MAG: universal stress protein [Moraxellaceae bacterium]|nr:universal stress protein [Moraxellaceae bacterium]
MTSIYACIDGSPAAVSVCDYAAWAAAKLSAPITLLHVLDHQAYPVNTDVSGNIGLGARDLLLDELVALDEKRNRLALEQGKLRLEAARQHIQQTDASLNITQRQRHGNLVETLSELEDDIRAAVIGRQGETSGGALSQVGSQLESIIRTLHRPVLIAPDEFHTPRSALIAFDGSDTTRKGVKLLAASPLFADLKLHLIMIGKDTADNHAQLQWAVDQLSAAGRELQTAIRPGDVVPTLHAYQADHDIDLMVMGAYGHSRLREFFVGSTTNAMLQSTTSALLLLR